MRIFVKKQEWNRDKEKETDRTTERERAIEKKARRVQEREGKKIGKRLSQVYRDTEHEHLYPTRVKLFNHLIYSIKQVGNHLND